VAAIFGPASPYTHGIVASIAARFDVPHIEYVWRENEEIPPSMTINIFPDSELVSQVSRKKTPSTDAILLKAQALFLFF
jgi:hypothetical protein